MRLPQWLNKISKLLIAFFLFVFGITVVGPLGNLVYDQIYRAPTPTIVAFLNARWYWGLPLILGFGLLILWAYLRQGTLERQQREEESHREFFETSAQILSAGLLTELSVKSLQEFQARQFSEPENWVVRQLERRIWERASDHPYTLKLLVGESGFGKSAAAYRFLEQHINAGGYGLYIPESIIQTASSLEDALRQRLSQLHPPLLPAQATLISSFVPSHSYCVIIVDDINQTSDPPKLIRKLAGWIAAPFVIVCPVWPRFWKPVKDLENKSEIEVITIERMTDDEGIEAVQSYMHRLGLDASRLEAYSVAGKLRCDPLLIGSFGALLRNSERKDITILVENTVERYIEQNLSDAVLASENKLVEYDYRTALSVLVARMLQQRDLYPHWSAVKLWLSDSEEYLDALRELSHHGKLCQVSSDGEFRFQHDRILEYFSIDCIVGFLNNRSEYEDILSEPYYAEFIGKAILKSPQSDAILDEIRYRHPLVLVSSLRYIGTPTSDNHRNIISKIKEWVHFSGSKSSTLKSIRAAVVNSFLNTDSPAVLDIVNTNFGLEVNWLGDWARFRNGDAKSGVRYCRIAGMESSRDDFWEELVEHAKLNHRQKLIAEIEQLLEQSDDAAESKATIVLIGFLGMSELQRALATWWQRQVTKPNYLAEVLWTAFRCSDNLYEDQLLDSLIDHWASQIDIEETKLPEYQQEVIRKLGPALQPDAEEGLISYLVSQAQKHPILGLPIAQICGRMDRPDSIEFAVRQYTENDEGEWSYSTVSHWGFSLGDRPRLSSDSVIRLQNLWDNPENNFSVRKFAFEIWLKNVSRESADVLGSIAKISPDASFYRHALWERARLGDRSCVPELVLQLETDIGLFYVAAHVWCDEISRMAKQRLKLFEENTPKGFAEGTLDAHYSLAWMMTLIPAEQAERLLLENWGHLRYSRFFVQAALYVGTLKSLGLAAEAIKDYPEGVNPFENLDSFYGFHDPSKRPRLTLQHFKNLQPYLHFFDEYLLRDCGMICYRSGGEWIDWCKQHLSTSVNDICRGEYCPTTEDLIQQLEYPTGNKPNWALHLLDKFGKREDPHKFLDIIRTWLQLYPSYHNLEVAARCIEIVGTRQDINILDVPLEYEWEKYQATILKESTWFAVCRRTLK
jgi:hypothetical protein